MSNLEKLDKLSEKATKKMQRKASRTALCAVIELHAHDHGSALTVAVLSSYIEELGR